MRSTFIAILLGLALAISGTTPSLAQAGEKITGKTCNELFRSCFRICAIHIGEPAYRGCEADCNNGQQSCRSTGVWKSKNATVTVQPRPAKKKKGGKK
jgi:hypothetical protein